MSIEFQRSLNDITGHKALLPESPTSLDALAYIH